jgi:hypothetical protein
MNHKAHFDEAGAGAGAAGAGAGAELGAVASENESFGAGTAVFSLL